MNNLKLGAVQDSEVQSVEDPQHSIQVPDNIDPNFMIGGSLKKPKNLVYTNMQGNRTIYNANVEEYEPLSFLNERMGSSVNMSLHHRSSRVLLKKQFQPRRKPETDKERKNKESLQKLSMETHILKEFMKKMSLNEPEKERTSKSPSVLGKYVESGQTLETEQDQPKKLKVYDNRQLRQSPAASGDPKKAQNADAVRASQLQMQFLNAPVKKQRGPGQGKEDALPQNFLDAPSYESQTILKKDSTNFSNLIHTVPPSKASGSNLKAVDSNFKPQNGSDK